VIPTISLLAKWILKPQGKEEAALRKEYGILCGAVGVFLNVLLFAGKFFAGLISGSVAIIADAFNNLSDAGSSIITLLGFYLAGQKPDPDHPFGHGRIEYLSGLAVAMLIILMGFELAKSSVIKILNPALVDSGPLVIAILCGSIAVKLYMTFYNRRIGKQLNSSAMLATAADSLSDCVSTAAVLAATLVGQFTGAMIDGWAGLLVAGFIFWSGFSAARATINPLLGTPPSRELVSQICDLVMAHPTVLGIHDLIVHDYGPGRMIISLHAEVPASGNVLELHDEIDNIEKELQTALSCVAVIHMDPILVNDPTTTDLRKQVAALVQEIDEAISIHDFRVVAGPSHTNVIFDAVVPFRFRLSDQEVERQIQESVRKLEGNYFAVVNVERAFT